MSKEQERQRVERDEEKQRQIRLAWEEHERVGGGE